MSNTSKILDTVDQSIFLLYLMEIQEYIEKPLHKNIFLREKLDPKTLVSILSYKAKIKSIFDCCLSGVQMSSMIDWFSPLH